MRVDLTHLAPNFALILVSLHGDPRGLVDGAERADELAGVGLRSRCRGTVERLRLRQFER